MFEEYRPDSLTDEQLGEPGSLLRLANEVMFFDSGLVWTERDAHLFPEGIVPAEVRKLIGDMQAHNFYPPNEIGEEHYKRYNVEEITDVFDFEGLAIGDGPKRTAQGPYDGQAWWSIGVFGESKLVCIYEGPQTDMPIYWFAHPTRPEFYEVGTGSEMGTVTVSRLVGKV